MADPLGFCCVVLYFGKAALIAPTDPTETLLLSNRWTSYYLFRVCQQTRGLTLSEEHGHQTSRLLHGTLPLQPVSVTSEIDSNGGSFHTAHPPHEASLVALSRPPRMRISPWRGVRSYATGKATPLVTLLTVRGFSSRRVFSRLVISRVSPCSIFS